MSFQLEPDGTDLPADEQYRPNPGGPAHHAEATSGVRVVLHSANVEPFTADELRAGGTTIRLRDTQRTVADVVANLQTIWAWSSEQSLVGVRHAGAATDVLVWPANYWPVAQVRTAEAPQRSEAPS